MTATCSGSNSTDRKKLPALHQLISNNRATIIDYHQFQQAGYYIVLALVEKTADLLVCRRQKLRRQNWSQTGVDRLLLLATNDSQ
ncbi:MAG: hypothetical protein QGG39_07610 [Candidatus Poribacteria bacterium]|nr:hypothetical protein [Candidatus Poribacteria bacterium]